MLAVGPAASQIAIKQLGTNGGGFFNVNSAHPFENPTPLSNFLEMLSILADPGGALLHVRQDGRRHAAGLGAARGDARHLRAAALSRASRRAGRQPGARARSASTRPRARSSPGGNMEGKEVRFGIANSALWATATTAASNGSVNAMHDSFTPLGGLVPMWLMQLGEVIFGGVGSGLYGMLMFAIVAVFVAGLMVGRTPEYLGKKIEAYEMKMASLVILVPAARGARRHRDRASCAEAGTSGDRRTPARTASARCSTRSRRPANNNGSAFAGLGANTPFYNTALGIAMFFARFWLDDPGARDRRLARGEEARARRRRARCRRTRRSSSCCSSAIVIARRRAHVHPRARARPDRRAPACCMTHRRPIAMTDAADPRLPTSRSARPLFDARRSSGARSSTRSASSTRATRSATR